MAALDEAWWGGTSVANLQRGYDVIKQEDTNHPVEQTHAPRGTVADLQPYNSAADILALDIYPVGYPPGANWLLTNKEISMVGDYTDFLSQVANGQKHYWMVEQIAWSGPPWKFGTAKVNILSARLHLNLNPAHVFRIPLLKSCRNQLTEQASPDKIVV